MLESDDDKLQYGSSFQQKSPWESLSGGGSPSSFVDSGLSESEMETLGTAIAHHETPRLVPEVEEVSLSLVNAQSSLTRLSFL